MIDNVQHEAAKHLRRVQPQAFNHIATERDALGVVRNFREGTLEQRVYFDETEDGEQPIFVDELHFSDGSWMLPAIHLVEDDGYQSPIGAIADNLRPTVGVGGRSVLRNPLYTPLLGPAESDDAQPLDHVLLAAEETIDHAHISIRFEAQFNTYPSGLWIAAESIANPADIGRVYVARLALLIFHEDEPGLIPIVFSADGAIPGYLPPEFQVRVPWLYAPVSDADFED